jgi:Uma2 family endonuclease
MEIRELTVAYGKNKFTEDEFLRMERLSKERHEYYRGEIFRMHGHGDLLAMSGAGDNHNEIFTNLFGDLAIKLKGKKCKPYGPDMRMHIPENTLYTYPDIAIYANNLQIYPEVILLPIPPLLLKYFRHPHATMTWEASLPCTGIFHH